MLIFENHGVIDPRLITTLGVNVKENASPIGFFGTGLKYAIAASLRLGFEVTIQAGNITLTFETKTLELRGRPFQLIHMNDVGCQFRGGGFTKTLDWTTELGKTWEPWMVYREFLSNMMDEEGRLYEADEVPEPDPGLTRIIVSGLETVHAERAQWFLETQPLAVCRGVEIHPWSRSGVFYHGILVHELGQESNFTYNITSELALTEDRTAANSYEVLYTIRNRIAQYCSERELLGLILSSNEESFEGKLDFTDEWAAPSETFISVVSDMSRSPVPVNRSAVRHVMQHNDLVNPRPATDAERKALDSAMRRLSAIGVVISSVKIVSETKGRLPWFVSKQTIYLGSAAFEDDKLLSILLEAYLDTLGLVRTEAKLKWVFEKLEEKL